MFKKLNTAILLFIVLFSACKPSVKNGLSYDEYVKLAREYKNANDYDRAIAAGKKAVGIKPQDGEAHYLLAMLYYEGWRKSFDAAQMKGLQDTILNPGKQRNSDPKEELKRNGLKSEWETLAKQEFKETIKCDPKNWFARYMIATDYYNNKHFREAIDEYKKVIEINPKYANSYSLMGEAYYKLGEYNAAIQPLQMAIKIDPNSVEDFLNLGLTYRRINNWKKYAEIAKKLKSMDKSRYDRLVNPLN